jgi:hypothetical protein
MRDHVTPSVQTCFYQLRRLRSTHTLLGQHVAVKRVSTLVLTRLDYCNAVLAGLTTGDLRPRQKVINMAVHLVLYLSPRNHVTSTFLRLHWLSSNLITRICWSFTVDLLVDGLYSKSPANLQQIRCVAGKSTGSLRQVATNRNGFVCEHLDTSRCCRKIRVSPKSRWQIRSMWLRTDKSTANLQHL